MCDTDFSNFKGLVQVVLVGVDQQSRLVLSILVQGVLVLGFEKSQRRLIVVLGEASTSGDLTKVAISAASASSRQSKSCHPRCQKIVTRASVGQCWGQNDFPPPGAPSVSALIAILIEPVPADFRNGRNRQQINNETSQVTIISILGTLASISPLDFMPSPIFNI